MSIIHDALKKVQQSNPGGAPKPAAPLPPQPRTPDPANMPERTNIPLLVAVLCAAIAMLFAALPHFTSKGPAASVKNEKPAALPQPAQNVPPPVPGPVPPSTHAMAQALAGAVAVPTVPAGAQTVPVKEPTPREPADPNDPLGSVQIEGVLETGGKKAVLINGNIYEEGQTIYGRIIMQISFDELTVIDNGRKRVLRIKP